MTNLVIGTAGHIDHGKTTLVKALTGIDTDRLKEEKERGITIELGFAQLNLPSGNQAAIIDVPGHERFIKNMLAGAAGIDLALMVIAANEGVMPQTREHFDIVHLLEIKELVVVITKADLVDQEFMALVRQEVCELLQPTPYRAAPIIEVSALTGEGLNELKFLLDNLMAGMKDRASGGDWARIPVDRVFTIQGFGAVVTGTLFNGSIVAGDILEIPTRDKRARVRNLQVHNQQVNRVVAGQRAAVNLTGVNTTDLYRGDVLAAPGWLKPTRRIDVSCRLLSSSPWPLQNQTRVRFHQGTKETLGRVVLWDRDELKPGEEAYIQLILEEPVALLRGDNYIIRSYSPPRTIGGGRVVEPLAAKYKNTGLQLMEELKIKAAGSMGAIIRLFLDKRGTLVSLEEIAQHLGIKKNEAQGYLLELVSEGSIEILYNNEQELFIASPILVQWEVIISREIKKHHLDFPLSPGLNKEELRGRVWPGLAVKDYNTLIQYFAVRNKLQLLDGLYLAQDGKRQQLSPKLAEKLKEVEIFYEEGRWQVPSWDKVVGQLKMDEKMGTQILLYLTRKGKLVSLGENLYAWHLLVRESLELLRGWFAEHEELTVAQARDLLGATRRLVVPLLEYLDKQKVTIRVGEGRRAGPAGFDTSKIDQL